MDPDVALRDIFGLAAFRPGQRAVVDAVLSGQPTIAVMPTGAGKSLCYQLPAVVAGGLTLVVSPLIALMKDQVDALTDHGIPACAINSSLSGTELTARLDDMAAGRVRLAYVAPERFRSPRFEEALSRVPLSLLAIDEAHCISEWGHDFRPDYMRLGEVVARWRPPRVVALTATATPEVRRDIQKQLGFVDPHVFVRGFDRPNLHYSVEQVKGGGGKADKLIALVRARTGPTLVYAATRKNAESYAEELRTSGAARKARVYHAGLGDMERAEVQDAFMNGETDVVVATNAFGMGVDKADIRLVLHADLPRSPEAYYQEAGRGGRDGDPASCVLLFNHSDVKLQEFLIDSNSPSVELLRALWKAVRGDPRLGADQGTLRRVLPGQPSDSTIATGTRFLLRTGYLRDREGVMEAIHPSDNDGYGSPARLDASALAARADIERGKLRAMVDYVYSPSCRRRFILAYFGDEDARTLRGCGGCDTCNQVRTTVQGESRAHIEAALSVALKLGGRLGRRRIAGLLVGDDEDDRYLELPGRGALRREGSTYAMDLLRVLEGAGLLLSSGDEYPTLSITGLGKKVLGGQEVALALPSSPGRARAPSTRARKRLASPTPVETTPADPELLLRLKQFRRETAQQEGLPAYLVFADKTLDAIARARPADLASLGVLPGIGPIKLEKYGATLLGLVRSQN